MLFNRLLVTALRFVPRPLVGRVAQRYVAGETLDQALDVVASLNGEGAVATVDVLGESVSRREDAAAAVDEYREALRQIQARRLGCNISVKPTQLGLDIEEAFCADNIGQLVELADQLDNFVRIDMEDRSTTEATLRIYHGLRQRFPGGQRGRVGAVLQAYMRRTLSDIRALPDQGANIRLCKGIYIEPRPVAWKGFDTVRANYLAALEALLRRDIYVGIATHDEALVCGAEALIDRLGVARERYEFQMLLGVDAELRRILVAGGHRVRIYVPYGPDWYLYSMRRLRENPEVAGHVARALLRGDS